MRTARRHVQKRWSSGDQSAAGLTLAVILGRGARGVAPVAQISSPARAVIGAPIRVGAATRGLIPLAASRAVAQLG